MADESPVQSETPAAAPLALSENQIAEWRERLKRAEAKSKEFDPWRKAAFRGYAPTVDENPSEYQTLRPRTNRAFGTVNRKVADLFYRRPDVTVTRSPLLESLPNGAAMRTAHANLLNEKLGIDGVDAVNLYSLKIFDYALYGAGWSRMGYTAYTQDVQRPALDPVTGQPVIDPLTGEPKMDTVPVPLKSECYWCHVEEHDVLVPSELRSVNFDKDAPWLAYRGSCALNEAKRRWGAKLPKDFKPSSRQDDSTDPTRQTADALPSTDTVYYTHIWYRTSVYREDVIHPDRLSELVFVEGVPEPVEHRDSPLQKVDEQGGLTPDSLIGFPLESLIIRKVSGQSHPVSDVGVGLPQVQELDKYREDMVAFRQIAKIVGYYNTKVLAKAEVEKVVAAPDGGLIGLTDEAFNHPDGPIRWADKPTLPPENRSAEATISADYDRTMTVDANTSGVIDASNPTATEVNNAQANRNVATGKEQNTVADCYIRGVTKFSTILQRYLSVEDAAAIIGPEAAGQWDQWRKAIPTRLAFTMLPDSSLRNDTPLHRKQLQDLYTFLANDPTINRAYLNEKLLEAFHLDPQKAVLPQAQVPQPKPEPPKLSFSFKGDDLNPLMPQAMIVFEVMRQNGIVIPPTLIQAAVQTALMLPATATDAGNADTANGQPPHGGKVAEAESLEKHQSEATGGMQGSGDMVPGMAGGMGGGVVQ